MSRPKGSKNKPKSEIPEPTPRRNTVIEGTRPSTPPKQARPRKKVEEKPQLQITSTSEISQPHHRNLVIMDAATGEIIGPDKSLDLSVSGRKHYSHSFIKGVGQCSAQAYFKVIHAPQRKAFALERGSCVHTLLEDFAKHGKDPIAGLPDMWKHYITDHLSEMSAADQDKATKEYDNTLEMLIEFVDENKELFEKRVRPEDVEVEFNIEIPLRLGDKHFTRLFNGKMDLVLWSADRTKYRIIDYKTVGSQPSDNELALDAQFSLYQYAATKLYGFPPTQIDFYMLKGIHLCKERFSSKSHPRKLGERVHGCEVTYALKVPRKTDEQIQELFDTYYAPLIVKFESGFIAKEGRTDIRNRCNMCTFFEHCNTVKSFPAPRFV